MIARRELGIVLRWTTERRDAVRAETVVVTSVVAIARRREVRGDGGAAAGGMVSSGRRRRVACSAWVGCPTAATPAASRCQTGASSRSPTPSRPSLSRITLAVTYALICQSLAPIATVWHSGHPRPGASVGGPSQRVPAAIDILLHPRCAQHRRHCVRCELGHVTPSIPRHPLPVLSACRSPRADILPQPPAASLIFAISGLASLMPSACRRSQICLDLAPYRPAIWS
ncbi:hypothetical protein OBBRIDRAFT_272215 [Obba rivulosa]|uniref:Uncharacterized protein n=1 Tax=Obba rivulosa TaxID=1052685 RepID=A0A8E2AM90_9APHY|nr:hypothetical protein OBBRIDRAFT_272215 [Obba rivulosa]